MIVALKGHFTNHNIIEMTFRCVDGNVEFYGLSESYLQADTRGFWINFMGQINEN